MASVSLPLFVNSSPADSVGAGYARASVPLACGEFNSTPQVSITNAAEEAIPVQSELLTAWPDGSPRILHLTFPARGGAYDVKVGETEPVAHPSPISLSRGENDHITISTGRLTAVIGGQGLVQSIRLGNEELLTGHGIDARVTDSKGSVFSAGDAASVRTEIETEGPLRSVIALSGQHSFGPAGLLHFRLRLEFLAGIEGFSAAYTFFNLEPGQDYLDIASIELEFKLAGPEAAQSTLFQQSYGIFSTLGRVVTTAEPLHVVVDDRKSIAYVDNFEALGDNQEYPFYLNPPPDQVDNWAQISRGARSMLVEMDDFNLLRPKSLHLNDGAATFGIWPARAGMLNLQQGRSRQVTVRVILSDQGPIAEQAQALIQLASLRDVWRAQFPQQAYAHTRFFDQSRVLPFDPGKRPRFEGWLSGMAPAVTTYCRFFDLGDTPDSGYQSTYTPLNRIRRVRSEDGGARYFAAGLHYPAGPLNGMHDFEPVWVNNEYDVIFGIGSEFLRTGNLSLFQKLRWFSRHTIDVDFLHYSDHQWLNRAQPAHSERHTTTGAYPSHFWTQGLAQYYMLTGDPDALEVIIALAEKTIEHFEDPTLKEMSQGLNREVGWGILSLVCAYETTGTARFDEWARKLLDQEMDVALPGDLPHFSFGHTSILLGARQYLDVHKGEPEANRVREWFLKFVDLAIRCSREAPPPAEPSAKKTSGYYSYDLEMAERGLAYTRASRSGIFGTHSMALDPVAYAYEITGDERYIKSGLRSLEYLVESNLFREPVTEGKPFAMMYRTFINYLKAAANLGYLKSFEFKQ